MKNYIFCQHVGTLTIFFDDLLINFFFNNIKPQPNDPNMPTQHVATLFGATCCVRLATVL